ncbi:MAG: 3-phosphoserine/phosphohydroxythreonine transaminase [Candidatus Hydrogenedentota bacterium]
MSDVFNFSAGPAILPKPVLEEAQRDLLDISGSGISVLESSHRSKEYIAIQDEAEDNMRSLLNVSDDYHVLFLQGGASQQFAVVPMNLMKKGQSADYTLSGAWGKKAVNEAKKVGDINVIVDCAGDRPCRVPTADELNETSGSAYLHITSNETISGAQWKNFPKTTAPLVADMSSDILSRRFDISDFGVVYAGAQKNMGPSGVTMVIVRKDLAEQAPQDLPGIFRYQTHADNGSMFNTPPCFSVYLLMLVTRWLKGQGGTDGIEKINIAKAGKLYGAIDATEFYSGAAAVEHRSLMNVTFNLPTEELEAQFAKEADAVGLKGLKGHRSVGGLRASIYNAFPAEGVDTLVSFMQDFEKANG